jgi:hypothetical protein
MRTFVVLVLVLCTAPAFAFYVCCSAAKGKPIPAPVIKAFGSLLAIVFALALASFGTDVDWSNAFRPILWMIGRG